MAANSPHARQRRFAAVALAIGCTVVVAAGAHVQETQEITSSVMLAGQGVVLSSVHKGEYRLGITVTDLLSRITVSRDVTFTVVGS